MNYIACSLYLDESIEEKEQFSILFELFGSIVKNFLGPIDKIVFNHGNLQLIIIFELIIRIGMSMSRISR